LPGGDSSYLGGGDRLGLESSKINSSGFSASVRQESQMSSGGGSFDFKISAAPQTYLVFSTLGSSSESVGISELEVCWSFVLIFGSSLIGDGWGEFCFLSCNFPASLERLIAWALGLQ
jgi:hypothetical protein